MSFVQIVTIVVAHWKLSLAIAAAVLVLAGVVTKLMPKTYSASATLIINYDANDPMASANKGIPDPMGRNSYMATQIELIKGPEVLDEVIRRLNLAADPAYSSGNRGGEATLRSWVESRLLKNLDIEPGRGGSQLIYITAWAHRSDLAADIANAIADIFVEQEFERMNGPATDRAKRYTEELADLKKKVAAAQEAVTQFRRRTGAIDLDTKADLDMDSLSALEHRLLEARNSLRSNVAHSAGSQDSSAAVQGSNLVSNLREEGAKLKAKLAQLRTTLGPNHPQIIELQSQIAANDASLKSAIGTYSSAASSDILASRTEVGELERAVEGQRQKVLLSRQFRDEGAKYQLELESAQSVYKRALDGYDQIMFASTGHFSNITIASRARPALKADEPKAVKNLLLGALIGLALGVAGPFAFELLHRRVRCRDDVERDLGIPILTEFQSIAT